MKYKILVISALAAFAAAQDRADNFVTITPTGAGAATVTNRWTIGGGQSGLGYIDGNSGFPGATATNFFTITGAAVPPSGNSAGFVSYLPTGAATPQGTIGDAFTPDSYSGLTYVAANLSLIGPLSFYAIHHGAIADYLALIQPSVPTVSDQKPMSGPGGPLTPGGTGYFALSFAADNPGGWGAELFYYLRTDTFGETIFGSMIPALLSGPADRWNLGVGRGFTDLAYTSTNVGFGFGPSQFYYLRLDPVTGTTIFGRLDPLTGAATDIQDLGGVYRTLVFTTTDIGYGPNNFYSIGQPAPLTPVITSSTVATGPLGAAFPCQVGAPFAYQITASNGPTSFQALNLPAGLGVDSANGAITGTPTEAGTFDVSLSAANAYGQGPSTTLVLTVIAPPGAPVISSAASESGQVAVAFSYAIVAAPGPITGYHLAGTLPPGVTADSCGRVISGTPTTAGIFTVELTASNSAGTSQPFALEIIIAPAGPGP